MKKKGISLIVLIITIIVVIVLASVVILTISKNNPIESAKEARFKDDIRTFQDELAMYISSEMVKDYNGIREKITTSNMPSTDEMKKYISSFSKKYEHKLGIYNDELIYYIADEDENVTNKVTDQEEKWLKDLGIKERVIETPEELFEWGSNDPNNPAYHTLVKYNGTEENVTVPKRCKVIGTGNNKYGAFCGNTNIKKVKLQDGVQKINNFGFYYCTNLESIKLSKDISSLGTWCFSGCTKLNEIELPESLNYISSLSFCHCENLEKITIPENVTSIGEEAFRYCYNLKSVELPESIKSLGKMAFSRCGLQSINIPKKCTYLADYVFLESTNLKEINVDDDNTAYCGIDGVLYSKNKERLICYPIGKENKSYSTIEETKTICDSAFAYCKNIKEIRLSENIENIQQKNFYECNNLEKINIPISVNSIGYETFRNCNKLVINCESEQKPDSWPENWYGNAIEVNWGVTN